MAAAEVPSSLRDVARARSTRRGQRVWNRQPVGGSIGLGISPASVRRTQAPRRVGTRDRGRAAPGCTGAAGRRTRASVAPVSTMRPRYITATRWLRCSTTERSWLTNRIARPRSRCSSASRFRICACTETSRARHRLVGHDQAGARGERRGDPHALALPARQLVRAPVARAMRQAHAVEQLARRARRARPAVPSAWASSASRTLRPTVQRGIERAERILEHGLDTAPEDAPGPARSRASTSVPSNTTRPAVGSSRRRMQRAERALARARLADHREHLARRRPRGRRLRPRGAARSSGTCPTAPGTASRALDAEERPLLASDVRRRSRRRVALTRSLRPPRAAEVAGRSGSSPAAARVASTASTR